MKAYIKREGCISCGFCVTTCPNVFRMADDGLAEVFADPVPATDEISAIEAQENCPVAVIKVEQ